MEENLAHSIGLSLLVTVTYESLKESGISSNLQAQFKNMRVKCRGLLFVVSLNSNRNVVQSLVMSCFPSFLYSHGRFNSKKTYRALCCSLQVLKQMSAYQRINHWSTPLS